MIREDVYVYDIRYERGQWKIAKDRWIFNRMELPEDIDKKAAAIMENRHNEQKAVLADLRTYYTAYNAEDLDLTVQYTNPTIIASGHWTYSDDISLEQDFDERGDSLLKQTGNVLH